MAIQLLIDEQSYVLSLTGYEDETELTRMQGGASALMASPHIQALQIEHAIEIAENWLMPYATQMRGDVLDVQDVTGRLEVALVTYADHPAPLWSIEDIEKAFATMLDRVLHQEPAEVEGVADMILLRELAHHGQVSGVLIHR